MNPEAKRSKTQKNWRPDDLPYFLTFVFLHEGCESHQGVTLVVEKAREIFNADLFPTRENQGVYSLIT